MRFSAVAMIAALSALSTAQDGPLDQYKAKFEQVLGQMSSYVPNPGRHDPIAAHEAKTGPMKLSVLTLQNWRETLYEPVAPDATTPEEWWILLTGRNKTCFGRCDQAERAFKETAVAFAERPDTPHMALLNCDDQPILCSSWSANAGHLYTMDMLPEPAPIDVYKMRLNLTAITTEYLVELHGADKKENFVLVESWFHPFNGKAAELGLSVPLGYILWAFNLVPSWIFMVLVSFGSRSMMTNRIQQQARRPAGAPATAQPK